MTVQQDSGVLGEVFSGTALTLSRAFTTLIILFFLLSAGDRLLRGLVEILPRFQDKRQVVEIATEIEDSISAYLLTITADERAGRHRHRSRCGCAGWATRCCGGPRPRSC